MRRAVHVRACLRQMQPEHDYFHPRLTSSLHIAAASGIVIHSGMRWSCSLFQPWRHGSGSIIAESWAVVHTVAWNNVLRECWIRAFCYEGIISTFWFLWQKIVFRTWLIDETCPLPYIWMNSSSNASNLASICKWCNGLSSSSTMHLVTRGEHFFHAEKHILLERPFMVDVESHQVRVTKRGRDALRWTPRAHASSLMLMTRCVFPIP